MKRTNNHVFNLAVIIGLSALSACGGGGGSKSPKLNLVTPTTNTLTWVAGEFTSHSNLKNQCSANGTGSELAEKLWLRSYSNDSYLWYDEIPDENPAPFSVIDYFHTLKTSALTPSGAQKDRFHFTMSTDKWQELSTSGASVGYGFNIAIEQGESIDRKITVTYSEPNSPAKTANVGRGAVIVSVDGVDVATANDEASIQTLNHGLFPAEKDQSTTFVIQDLGAEESREVILIAQKIVSDPVPLVQTMQTDTSKVGYVVFNDHIATAEKGLYDAFTELAAEDVDELVIDFRYNGGGYLVLASQLGYMVAGEQTNNKTFEKTIFNDKHPNRNPVTGQLLSPTPFVQETVGLNDDLITDGFELPTLNLSRVYVLTTDGTCSASEAFINSMRGIDVQVIQIGSTTCGKPYGFYAADNCATTYFTVQFKGENNKGFGDYADGFIPSTSPVLDTEIQGCPVVDDLSHPLGASAEGMLSAATYYIDHNSCPEVPSSNKVAHGTPKYRFNSDYIIEDTRPQSQILSNRIMTQ